MIDEENEKRLLYATLAGVVKEMAKPRLASSLGRMGEFYDYPSIVPQERFAAQPFHERRRLCEESVPDGWSHHVRSVGTEAG
jgi:hypothetical protein